MSVMHARAAAVTIAVGAVAAALSGCGGGGESDAAPAPRGPSSDALRAQLERATSVRRSAFPSPKGRSLAAVSRNVDAGGLQLAFATQNVVPEKRARLAFGVLSKGKDFVYAPTAIYVARDSERGKARGPYVAPADLLITDAPFRSQSAATASDPFAAIYETHVPFSKPGRYAVMSLSVVNGRTHGATGWIDVRAGADEPIPDVGSPAPKVATDTLASAGGDIKKIDTRVPPSDMHKVSLDKALGKQPVAVLFSTPQLCQSRVCGPVVDIAAQLKKTYGSRMAFIHQEVYVDNQVAKGLRPPLRAFKLETEPWLFVMDASGRITARLEGSFGFRAFEAAIRSGLSPATR